MASNIYFNYDNSQNNTKRTTKSLVSWLMIVLEEVLFYVFIIRYVGCFIVLLFFKRLPH